MLLGHGSKYVTSSCFGGLQLQQAQRILSTGQGPYTRLALCELSRINLGRKIWTPPGSRRPAVPIPRPSHILGFDLPMGGVGVRKVHRCMAPIPSFLPFIFCLSPTLCISLSIHQMPYILLTSTGLNPTHPVADCVHHPMLPDAACGGRRVFDLGGGSSPSVFMREVGGQIMTQRWLSRIVMCFAGNRQRGDVAEL